MKLTCCMCNKNPRASVKQKRCLPCAREYRASRVEEYRAASRKYYAKKKEELRVKREERIRWWLRQSPEALKLITDEYRRTGKRLPLAYYKALNRRAKARGAKSNEFLKRLPSGLRAAIERHAKVNRTGSTVRDFDAVRHLKPEDEARYNKWTERDARRQSSR